MPIAANYGIQGAAADVMYRAMYRVQELRNRHAMKRNISLCATVHDELLLAVSNEMHIPLAEKLITDGMEQAWLDIFPGTSTDNLIEAKSGRTWGDAK